MKELVFLRITGRILRGIFLGVSGTDYAYRIAWADSTLSAWISGYPDLETARTAARKAAGITA